MSAEKQKTILLVEDEAIIAMAEKMTLEKYGYRVLAVHRGEDAVTAVAQTPGIDLILMDIDLGAGMDGTEAAALILKDRDLPVVFLSSHAEPEVVAKTEKITSYGYVLKGSSVTVLDASIKMAFRLFEAKIKEEEREAALQRSEEKYHTLFRGMLDGFALHEIICDREEKPVDYRFLEVNPMFERMTGLQAAAIIGRTVLEVLPGTERHWIETYGNVALTGEPAFFENYTAALQKHFKVTAFRPAPRQFACIFVDITEQKRAEEELKNSKLLLQSSIESPKDMIILSIDRHYRYLYFNKFHKDVMAKAYGKDVQLGMNLLECITHEADRLKAKINYDRALAGENHATIEEYGDLNRYYYETRYNPIINDRNEVIGATAFSANVTERKRVEEALRESVEAFRGYFNMGTIGMCVTSPEKGWIEVNDCLCRILGYSREELQRLTWAELTHPDDLQADLELFNEMLAGRRDSYELEKRFIRKDSQTVHTRIFVTCHRGPGGGVGYVLASLVDISEQKRAERERPLLQEIAQGILSTGDLHEFLGIVHHAIAKITRADNFFVALYNKETGMFEEAYSADKFDPCFPPSKLEKSLSKYVFRSGRPLRLVSQEEFAELVGRGEVELVGTPSPSWMGVPLMAAGEAIGVMVAQDYEKEECYSPHDLDLFVSISGQVALAVERKRWEDAMKRQLEEKIILLKEVHHRIKNNIASIGSLISLRMQSLSNPEALAVLQDAVGRIGSMRILYDKLLLSEDYKDIPVKNYLESLADTVVSLFPDKAKATLEKHIADFNLDAKRLFPLGIILNELLTNIMKYAFIDKGSGLIKLSLTLRDKHVTLTMQDNGVGLPDGFDMENSKGFGLMLVKMLSQQLGGSFSIKNDNGTRSTLEFDM